MKSAYALHFGLGVSLLERLMKNPQYQRNAELYEEGYNPNLVCILTVEIDYKRFAYLLKFFVEYCFLASTYLTFLYIVKEKQ